MRATIRNRRVKCPHCHQEFEVKRAYGEGAGYVEDWDRVPVSVQKLIAHLVCRDEDILHDKTDLRDLWECRGIKMSDNAANARVSELVGLNVLKMMRFPDGKYHDTERAPQYEIQFNVIDKLYKDKFKLPARLSRFV